MFEISRTLNAALLSNEVKTFFFSFFSSFFFHASPVCCQPFCHVRVCLCACLCTFCLLVASGAIDNSSTLSYMFIWRIRSCSAVKVNGEASGHTLHHPIATRSPSYRSNPALLVQSGLKLCLLMLASLRACVFTCFCARVKMCPNPLLLSIASFFIHTPSDL